jgi:formate hydrogenlyase subunit 6/NADH:ubiquinone oxidoreductase subunit I
MAIDDKTLAAGNGKGTGSPGNSGTSGSPPSSRSSTLPVQPGEDESTWKRTTFGSGLVKGLGITLRHLLSRSVTVEYPDEKDVLPPRSRGVIALKEENCTMCMLCGRECPDWCIYIEGHKERREPKEPGKRAKAFNVLDRFAIDFSLCMYCGICVEVCPYDALFWSPYYEYAEYDIVELTHEKDQLNDWMYHVLPPAPLDPGAKGPEFKIPPKAVAAAAAPAAAPTAPAAPAAPKAPAAAAPAPAAAPAAPAAPAAGGEDPAAVRKRVYEEELAKGSDPRVAEARSKAAEMRAKKAARAAASAPAGPAPAAQAPAAPAPAAEAAPAAAAPSPAAAPAAAAPAKADGAAQAIPDPHAEHKQPESAADTLEQLKEHMVAINRVVPPEQFGALTEEEAAAVRAKVYEDEVAKGTEPAVAESLARLAEVVSLQGFRRPDWK